MLLIKLPALDDKNVNKIYRLRICEHKLRNWCTSLTPALWKCWPHNS